MTTRFDQLSTAQFVSFHPWSVVVVVPEVQYRVFSLMHSPFSIPGGQRHSEDSSGFLKTDNQISAVNKLFALDVVVWTRV